jgi:hypothetical protein
MSLLKSDKTMLAAGLMFLVLNLAVLAPLSTGGVQDAVDETFATYTKDTACANDDCTEAEADWAVSTSQRDYSAWTITNLDEMMANGSEPAYKEIGPFTYDITKTNTITGYDATNGTMTYTQVKSHQCAAESVEPCDTLVTQINIGFQPQVIGATGLAINGIMEATKAGFAAGAIGKEMESFSAGKATADGIATSYGGIQMGAMTAGAPVDAANASMMLGMGWYDVYDAYFASINGSQMNNLTGNEEMFTYTQAIQGIQLMMAGGPGNESEITFAGSGSIGDLSYAFDSAMMPTGEDASLTSTQGVLIFAGHCNAFATATYGEVMADAANGFANVGTMQRASIWGYASADINATIATDFAVCFGVGGTFSMTHGGADADWFTDPLAVNASARMMNYLGVDIDNTVAMGLLFGGQGTDMPTGILATNAVDEDDSPTAFGIAAFAGMDSATAMTTYGLDATQYAAVGAWVGGWLTSASALPMILLGGTGTMTAEQYVNISFGAEDPVSPGEYLTNSLNLGGAWGLVGESIGAPAVELTAAQSGNLLYGPLGLTTSAGATIFLYGELSGKTPPIDFTTMQPGPQMEWNASTIAALYGIDVNAASAVRALMMGPIYGETPASFVPGFLMSTFGTTQYLTQPVSAWLFGWHDPVSAFLASGNPMDMTVGWASLDTNETYYGSDGVLNGDGTSYTVCTGEVAGCDKGESVLEDGSNELPWHNTRMAMATFGLIGVEYLDGATGGFLTGTDDKVDVSGYAVVPVTCDATGTVKGIPVDICTASVEATSRSIQAKNLKTFTLLDATPSALPIFLGSDITLKSEKLSGLIIAGESTTTFYLDTRQNTNMTTAPEMSDLNKVFTIKSSSIIGAEDADTMESSIVTNQDSFTYWTNFDHPVDYITVLFYIGALLCVANGVKLMLAEEESEESNDTEKHDEAPVEITEEASE